MPSPADGGWDLLEAGEADSVELKVLVDDEPETAAARLTGRPSLRWRTRQVHLLDTPDLRLARSGLEVRLRRRARGRHDLTVRIRHAGSGARIPRPRGARVEVDVLPGAAWRTTELRRDLDDDRAADWAAGRLVAVELISPAQAAWAREQAGPDGAAGLSSALTEHGPLLVHRLRVPSARFPAARARLEYCRYPSGRRLVEFSARCAPADAPRVATAVGTFLAEHGVTPADRQRTKTAVWVDDLVGSR